jgi:hypothetical protein
MTGEKAITDFSDVSVYRLVLHNEHVRPRASDKYRAKPLVVVLGPCRWTQTLLHASVREWIPRETGVSRSDGNYRVLMKTRTDVRAPPTVRILPLKRQCVTHSPRDPQGSARVPSRYFATRILRIVRARTYALIGVGMY